MPAENPVHFPTDYAHARESFRLAALAAGAHLSGVAIDARGPDGEELTIDVAYWGPEAPRGVLAISSGVHGVEGFAGSALQRALLVAGPESLPLPRGCGALFVHALNPHGFATRRRVNESNVDLNRNFVDHARAPAIHLGYETLRDAINPRELGGEADRRSLAALGEFAREHGSEALQAALTLGQYRYPDGVQFGGQRAEASARALGEIAQTGTRGADRVAWVDVHTGLGAFGTLAWISEYADEHPVTVRARECLGAPVQSTISGGSVSIALDGVIERGLESALPDRTLIPLTAEFGTFEANRVFWALRADNWLHHRGAIDSERGRAIRAELTEVFCPADPAWRARVLATGQSALRGAATLLEAPSAAAGDRETTLLREARH